MHGIVTNTEADYEDDTSMFDNSGKYDEILFQALEILA